MFTDAIHIGDKVDINVIPKGNTVNKTPSVQKVYKSKVIDKRQNGILEMLMPMEKEKMVLLPLGGEFEFVFYVDNNLYKSFGHVSERYKKNNLYVIYVRLDTPLVKYQRREFYRYPCLIDIRYLTVKTENIMKIDAEKLFHEASENNPDTVNSATIVDLSGGGARIVGDEKLEVYNNYMLLELTLKFEDSSKTFIIIGNILSSIRIPDQQSKFDHRIMFYLQENAVREDIIRYIFNEERKNRNQKGQNE
ncbi:MAG: flagellar brake protein [Lachnospiraceae bacterium]